LLLEKGTKENGDKKIIIIDCEKKRTFVVRKGSLRDADLVNAHLSFASYCNRLLSLNSSLQLFETPRIEKDKCLFFSV
jgi:hypothetical protein